jgi:hypothetical protein
VSEWPWPAEVTHAGQAMSAFADAVKRPMAGLTSLEWTGADE